MTMTVARGLTRLKTIKAQLAKISGDIQRYGAINDKKRHPLGERLDMKENHNKAKAEVMSLFQQHSDLVEQFIKIKDAIDRSNLVTKITIGGKVMTVNQARIMQNHIQTYVQSLVGSYNASVANAERDVETDNARTLSGVEDPERRRALQAQVLYLVPTDKIKELNAFLVEFLTEIDGTLNEVNATTLLDIEE